MRFTMFKMLLVWALCVGLSACVTVTESRLTKKASPEKAVANYTELGLGYLQHNHLDMARDRLNKALAINENYAPANDAMGMVWQMEGELELAEESFKKAIREDKKLTSARHHLGLLYAQQKKFSQAEKELKTASSDPYYENRARAFNDLGMIYYKQNKTSDAMYAYSQTLRLSPYDVEALVNLSTLKFEAQEYDDANKLFERLDRLVQRDQTKHTAHSLWLGIKIATISQNTQRAIKFASELKRQFPNSVEYKLYRESLNGAR
ncbi:MAG: hypothetical protein RL217_986 [Pseudomonadota bacterium]|jgi:type IV pilus assembly protein PilF